MPQHTSPTSAINHSVPFPVISNLLPGGFIFKQWKKRFLLLTAEGSLLVCHDASSLPDQLVLLQSSCEAIVEGKEILDLPKLPSGGCRDCCFALILPQNKYLLLLAETPADCRSGGHCAFSTNFFLFDTTLMSGRLETGGNILAIPVQKQAESARSHWSHPKKCLAHNHCKTSACSFYFSVL